MIDLVNGILIFDEEVSGYEALEYAFSKKNSDFVIFVDNPIPLMSYHYEREILEKAVKYIPDYVYIENFIMGALDTKILESKILPKIKS